MVARSGGRGAFIVLEGVDRSGKSTQAERLVQRLQSSGVKAELWRFPDRTTAIGKMIDSYLKSDTELNDAAIHLLFSANRWEKRDLLLKTLQDGTSLIVDRYAFSGVVFTAAKKAPGLNLSWCKAPDVGLPSPDSILFLDLTIGEAEKRGGFGDERYENATLQKEVRSLYSVLAKETKNWEVIDASQKLEDITDQLFSHAIEVIQAQQNSDSEPRPLWT